MFTHNKIMLKGLPKVMLHVVKPNGAKLLPEADRTATLCSPFNVC